MFARPREGRTHRFGLIRELSTLGVLSTVTSTNASMFSLADSGGAHASCSSCCSMRSSSTCSTLPFTSSRTAFVCRDRTVSACLHVRQHCHHIFMTVTTMSSLPSALYQQSVSTLSGHKLLEPIHAPVHQLPHRLRLLSTPVCQHSVFTTVLMIVCMAVITPVSSSSTCSRPPAHAFIFRDRCQHSVSTLSARRQRLIPQHVKRCPGSTIQK